jgi:hypothetical protein
MRSKKDKFHVNRTAKGKLRRTFEGIVFDSEMELKYYRDYLLPLKKQGIVKNIILQPIFLLQSKFTKNGKSYLPIKYVSDFEVEYSNGETIIVDVKGLASETAKIKRKMFDYIYPDKKLIWVSYSAIDNGWIDYDILRKKRAERRKNKG